MKFIGLTQRVDIIASYDERRDALDQQWYSLLIQMKMFPIPLPNLQPELACELVAKFNLDGIIFTGGNSLCHLDETAEDSAPERDAFELSLIDYAVKQEIPILGVCRGMHIINHYFGGRLHQVEGHICKKHALLPVGRNVEFPMEVNSFHRWGISDDGLGDGLQPLATDMEGNIEVFLHSKKKVAGIMWHPERVAGFDDNDLNFIREIFYD